VRVARFDEDGEQFYPENVEKDGHWGDVGVGIRIIIKWANIYRMWGVGLVNLVGRWGHWLPV
jgi:hypothetical protein